MNLLSLAEVTALRSTVTNALWGATRYTIPTTGDQYVPPTPTQWAVNDLFGQAPEAWQWFGHQFHLGGIGPGMLSASFYATFEGSDKLASLNLGHGQGVFFPSPYPNDFRTLTHALVNAGCDIIINPMPFSGDNACFYQTVTGNPELPEKYHHVLGTDAVHSLPPGWGSRMRFWTDGPLRAIDRAHTVKSYDLNIMIGHSGGAHTALMCAAVEPSIDRCYSISGSLPAAYRGPAEPGPYDWEAEPGFIGLGFEDYPDAYLMCVAECDRKLWLMYNAIDNSFSGARAKPWARKLKEHAANGFGELEVKIDIETVGHLIGEPHRNAILADI